jgi:hypothetical protein
MATITGTLAKATEFAGDYKVCIIDIVPGSASDVVNITLAEHGIDEIAAVIPMLKTGNDANLMGIFATFSALAITVTTVGADGLAATDWTGATARLVVIGRSGV